MVRLVPSIRWDADKVANIPGVPMDFRTQHFDIVETDDNPHAHPEDKVEGESEQPKSRRLQISDRHMVQFGYTDGCPKCNGHRYGKHARAKHLRLNDKCRSRMYQAIRDAGGDTRDQPEEELPKLKEVKKP